MAGNGHTGGYDMKLLLVLLLLRQLRFLGMTGIPLFHSIPKRDGKKLIDDMWLYTALAMIGENFEAGEELCGAVIRCARLASLPVAS